MGSEGEVKLFATNKKKNPVRLGRILIRDLEVISLRNTHWEKALGLLCAFAMRLSRLHTARWIESHFTATYPALQVKRSIPRDEGEPSLKYSCILMAVNFLTESWRPMSLQ